MAGRRVTIMPKTMSCALAGLLLASTLVAQAAEYNEQVEGDLPLNWSPGYAGVPTLTLEDGVNTISGQVTWSYASTDDNDSILFVVPEDRTVTGAWIEMTAGPGTGVLSRVTFAIFDASEHITGLPGLANVGARVPSSRAAFRVAMPLEADTYMLSSLGFSGSLLPGEYKSANYEISFFVDVLPPVPEPAAASLLLLGLAACVAAARYRRGAC
jgi:hypothetical protein